MSSSSLTVDGYRLQADLDALSRFGRDPDGGVTRLAYTDADLAARDWLIDRLRAIGLQATVDAAGNVHGSGGPAPRVICGSHLDSVRSGGAYDGALGVVCALEIARVLVAEKPDLANHYGVVSFACEESVRFGTGCVGSRALTGELAAVDLDRLVDDEKTTLRQALDRAGCDPARLPRAAVSGRWCETFLELHIDQGTDLLEAGVPIGIVTTIMAPARFWVTVEGQAGHTGATRMAQRHDALAAAAEIIVMIERFSHHHEPEGVLASVGMAIAYPGTFNTVAGRVRLGVEIRAALEGQLLTARRQLDHELAAIAERRGVHIEWTEISRAPPTPLPERVISTLEDACRACDVGYVRMPSRAAHDAMFVARVAAAGMLLVRNRSGVSHSPAELPSADDVVTGAEVLLEAVLHILEQGNN